MWVYEKQNEIYTLLEFITKKKLSAKYPNLNFTKEEESSYPENSFPNVFIKFLNSLENAPTLKSNTVNALTFYIQIDVTANKTQGLTCAETVIWEVVAAAKEMGFQLTFSPEQLATGNDTKRMVAKMKRNIASGDKLTHK